MANDASLITYVREVPVQREADVVVIGGGSAGLNAAVAAARAGCRVTLIERYGFLGGTSTAVLDTFYGFFTPGSEPRRVVGGIPMEVVNALFDHRAAMYRPNTYGAGTGITYNPAVLKRVWDEIVTRAGVDLLLHAFCVDVLAEGGEVRGVIVATKAGLLCVRGRVYVDASGDADVADRAGAAVESACATGEVQSATTTFTLGGVDVPQAASVPRAEFVRLLQEAAASGEYDLPRKEGSIHRTPLPDVMVANMTRVPNVDGTDPASLTRAELEGRRQVGEYARFLIERVPGYERAYLAAVGIQIGIRESRRLVGAYRLTKEDVLAARKFPDGIAQCGAPIEDHHSGHDTHWQYLPEGEVYDIPYRALLPVEVENLLVAGRCLSATHDAHASCRSMAQCMAMGQAAGVAAAMAARKDSACSDVDVIALRTRLHDMGAILDGGRPAPELL